VNQPENERERVNESLNSQVYNKRMQFLIFAWAILLERVGKGSAFLHDRQAEG
jgi:hypothetical protein